MNPELPLDSKNSTVANPLRKSATDVVEALGGRMKTSSWPLIPENNHLYIKVDRERPTISVIFEN